MCSSDLSTSKPNAYSTSIAFGLLVLTLIFFPRGLVPERVDENV